MKKSVCLVLLVLLGILALQGVGAAGNNSGIRPASYERRAVLYPLGDNSGIRPLGNNSGIRPTADNSGIRPMAGNSGIRPFADYSRTY